MPRRTVLFTALSVPLLLFLCYCTLRYLSCNPYVCPPHRRSQPLRPKDATFASNSLDLSNCPPTTREPANSSHPMLVPRKGLVVAKLEREDSQWTQNARLRDWQKTIYVVDDPANGTAVPMNKGRESMAYLTYIIDHYERLPDFVVFSHAERYQWHNDDPQYDGVSVLSRLQLASVAEHGYVNLRCSWSPGCTPSTIKHPYSWLMTFGAMLEPHNAKYQSRASMYQAYHELFPEGHGATTFANDPTVPSKIGIPGGAQFAVSREKILERPRCRYVAYRNWLLNSELPDEVVGRIFEYSWHLIFRMPSLLCPTTSQCFCERFGRCNLKCDDAVGACDGFEIPSDFKVPADWPREQALGIDLIV